MANKKEIKKQVTFETNKNKSKKIHEKILQILNIQYLGINNIQKKIYIKNLLNLVKFNKNGIFSWFFF